MNNDRLLKIIQKYLDGKASESEKKAVETWYESAENHAGANAAETNLANRREKAFERFRNEINTPVVAIPWYKKPAIRVAAAIAIIISISAAVYYLNTDVTDQKNSVPALVAGKDIAAPRQKKSILELADGSRLDIDSSNQGKLAQQGTVVVSKNQDGTIAYSGNNNETSFNTLTVPRGSRPQQLQLADGSRVWLNVASSITYPVSFTGTERKVQISGEVYFEIAKNASKPFIVKNDNDQSEVKVLGTHFNVNAYKDEDVVKVTLLEGAVEVSEESGMKILKPGQQAKISAKTIVLNNKVDVDEVMAWKDGKFQFDGANIETIMRQVSKWYDVEVVFETKPKDKLVANISRDVNVSELLEILEKTDLVHFDINGKRILVKN